MLYSRWAPPLPTRMAAAAVVVLLLVVVMSLLLLVVVVAARMVVVMRMGMWKSVLASAGVNASL
jgi:hypothetical protein